MSYKGDQFILELLAQNLAKLGHEKEKEVAGSKSSAKRIEEKLKGKLKGIDENVVVSESRKENRHPDCTTESLTAALVYNHLSEISPKLAAEFASSCNVQLSSIKLQEVVAAWRKKSLQSVKNCKKFAKLDQQKTNNKVGGKAIRFTPKEDKVILAIVQEARLGVKVIDYASLARKLDRTYSSVCNRVSIFMRKGGGKTKRNSFSLIQDQIILETLVIPRLRNKKLSRVILGRSCFKELAELWNIDPSGLIGRWTMTLQPILLQHYSGTLNLRVERMLANYISENFTNFSLINWTQVAASDEFVGNTESSLRKKYFTTLSKNARLKLGVENSEMTPQHVAQYCEAVYGEGGKGGRMGSKKIQRQTDVIAFFEDKVAELGVVDFL